MIKIEARGRGDMKDNFILGVESGVLELRICLRDLELRDSSGSWLVYVLSVSQGSACSSRDRDRPFIRMLTTEFEQNIPVRL